MTLNDIKKGVAAFDEQVKAMEYTFDYLKVIADYDVNVTREPGNKIRFGNHFDYDIPKGHNGIPPTLMTSFLDHIKAEYQDKVKNDILKYKKLQEERELLDLQKDFV